MPREVPLLPRCAYFLTKILQHHCARICLITKFRQLMRRDGRRSGTESFLARVIYESAPGNAAQALCNTVKTVPTTTIVFESALYGPRDDLWSWITDVRCLRREMMPVLSMTHPPGLSSIEDLAVVPGEKLFRSVILLAGFLPVGFSDLTLVQISRGSRFVEESPMLSMRKWRHEREILDHPSQSGVFLLRDTVTFAPRVSGLGFIAHWFVGMFFRHRHAVLRCVHGAH